MASPQPQPSLVRPIGLLHATAMVVGIIIGASIFVQPSEINRHAPTIPAMLAVWLAAGVLSLFGALVCAELSSVFTQTGGVYVYLKETLSPACGFLWGWAMFWSVHSGIIAASSVILARYIGYFFPLDATGTRMVAIVAIVALSAVNYVGVRQGSLLQTTVTSAKLLAIVLLLLFVVFYGAPVTRSAAPLVSQEVSFREFVLGVSAGLFAFGGWHMVAYASGETRDPQRTIPRALLVGVLIVTACYIALNAAYLYLLPLEKVSSSTRIAADAAATLAGSRGAGIVSALVIVSAMGVLNGVILAGPRMYLAMASEGLAFRRLGAIHPRFRTPYIAVLLQALWSSFLVATGTYRELFTRVVYTEWLFFALMTLGLFRLRRGASYTPGWRAWGYPIVPSFFLIAALVVSVISIQAAPVQAVTGLALVALGLPVYYFWTRSTRAKTIIAHANH